MTFRLVLLNAFPINAFPYNSFTARFIKTDFTEMKFDELRCGDITCFIRHSATVALINQQLGTQLQPNPGLYKHDFCDIIYIVSLKSPERGKEVTAISQSDVDIWKVEVIKT
jgi:hypothetical protein